jgi:hypothetical protein
LVVSLGFFSVVFLSFQATDSCISTPPRPRLDLIQIFHSVVHLVVNVVLSEAFKVMLRLAASMESMGLPG